MKCYILYENFLKFQTLNFDNNYYQICIHFILFIVKYESIQEKKKKKQVVSEVI